MHKRYANSECKETSLRWREVRAREGLGRGEGGVPCGLPSQRHGGPPLLPPKNTSCHRCKSLESAPTRPTACSPGSGCARCQSWGPQRCTRASPAVGMGGRSGRAEKLLRAQVRAEGVWKAAGQFAEQNTRERALWDVGCDPAGADYHGILGRIDTLIVQPPAIPTI